MTNLTAIAFIATLGLVSAGRGSYAPVDTTYKHRPAYGYPHHHYPVIAKPDYPAKPYIPNVNPYIPSPPTYPISVNPGYPTKPYVPDVKPYIPDIYLPGPVIPPYPTINYPDEPTLPTVDYPDEPTLPTIDYPDEPTYPTIDYPDKPETYPTSTYPDEPPTYSTPTPPPVEHPISDKPLPKADPEPAEAK